MQEIRTNKVPHSSLPLSQAIKVGNLIFASGTVGRDRDTGELILNDFERELHSILSNISIILEEAGSSIDRVCKVNAYVADAANFQRFNEIYVQYFKRLPHPARTTLVSQFVAPGVSIEMEFIAEA